MLKIFFILGKNLKLQNVFKMNYGYIYVRNHFSYGDTRKLGKTISIPERDSQYATCELNRGYFESVYAIPIKKLGIIERLLQYTFSNLHVKYDGGNEFYNKEIIECIEPYLISIGIEYKKLSRDDINNLTRINRVKETLKKINIKELINLLKSIVYIPRDYQTTIVNKSLLYFQENHKGILVLICGVGKTLISLWIAQKLKSSSILIGVPNKLLVWQWEEVIYKLFNVPCLIVKSGVTIEDISIFLRNNKKPIIITTYSSSYKVLLASQQSSYIFDIKINDEVHHLCGIERHLLTEDILDKQYIHHLNIPSIKQLSLTATLKYLSTSGSYSTSTSEINSISTSEINSISTNTIISNDSIDHFGKIIDKKCMSWAIKQNIICDYIIQIIITNEDQLSIFDTVGDDDDKRLMLSAFSSLKSIYEGHSHHLLIYLNNKHNLLKIIKFINILLEHKYFEIPEIYFSEYHSELSSKDQCNILNKFNNSKYGIIACVYCLGEGYDNDIIDGVVFAENMASTIRIVQSTLRASRKSKVYSNKLTKIILPILNKDDWLYFENSDLKKVKEVIYQLALEDETIIQKIKAYTLTIQKQKPKEKLEALGDIGDYDENITEKLKLKSISRLSFGITYDKAKKILAGKNIKSKKEYYIYCEKDIRLSKDPEDAYKFKFKGWVDYLSIERKYYELEMCKNKISEYLTIYPEIKNRIDLESMVEYLCGIDAMFPPRELWLDYYKLKDLKELANLFYKSNKKLPLIL